MKKIWTISLLIGSCISLFQIAFGQSGSIDTPHPNWIKFQMHPLTMQYLSYYQGRGRSSMEAGLFRFGTHEKMIRRIFREQRVPEHLAHIDQVQKMRSHTRILWFFSPQLAKKYGLRKTKFIDETRSFEKATRATAQYLKSLAGKYGGNWELAIAAYFSSERIIDRAIKRVGAANFWLLFPYLPAETRNFVPNVLATILIATESEKYGFGNIKRQPPLAYELVRIPPSIRLEMIAEFSEVSIETVRQLNPELIFRVTPPEPYVIRVPAGKETTLVQKMRSLPGKLRHQLPQN